MDWNFNNKKLFDKKAGIIIDSNGIMDNSSATSVGLIKWNDITGIKIKRVITTKFLLISVSNPEEYIAKSKSKMTSKLMRQNMKISGTPINITSSALKYNFKELEKIVRAEFEKNKK